MSCLAYYILTNLHLLIKVSLKAQISFAGLTDIDQVYLLHFLHESETNIQIFSLMNVHPRIHLHPKKEIVCVCVCVCVYETVREREREREHKEGSGELSCVCWGGGRLQNAGSKGMQREALSIV